MTRMALTPAEKAGDCEYCGARAGERCRTTSGVPLPGGAHAVRRGGVSTVPHIRPLDESYQVDLCGHCHHPGGGHVIDQWEPRVTHCRLCRSCPGWDDKYCYPGRWSDRQTQKLTI